MERVLICHQPQRNLFPHPIIQHSVKKDKEMKSSHREILKRLDFELPIAWEECTDIWAFSIPKIQGAFGG